MLATSKITKTLCRLSDVPTGVNVQTLLNLNIRRAIVSIGQLTGSKFRDKAGNTGLKLHGVISYHNTRKNFVAFN